MNIYLVRHGETDWNRAGRLQGHTDIPLNENGRMQIGQVAEVLADICSDIELILSSPLSRAYESAEIVADRLSYRKEDIIVEPLLIERCFGIGEGLTIAEREKYPGDNYPEMEVFEDLLSRAKSAFEKIVNSFNKVENILVVAHGALLYAMITAITDGKIEYGGKLVTFDQGSIHLIRYLEGAIEIARYSEEDAGFKNIRS